MARQTAVKLSPVLPLDPSDDELARDWTLSGEDLIEVWMCRGDDNRRRFAVQLCVLRNTGRFLSSYQTIGLKIINYLSRQLELSPILFLADTDREATESSFRQRLQRYLGWSDFTAQAEETLLNRLTEHAAAGFTNDELLREAEALLRSWQIVLPARSTLERLIGTAQTRASRDIFSGIGSLLAPEICAELDALLMVDPASGGSPLARLKEYPPHASAAAILNYLQKYWQCHQIVADRVNLDTVNSANVRHLAFLAKRSDVWTLKRFASEKRHSMLACFLLETEKTLLDHLVEMHDQFVTDLTRIAKARYEEQVRGARKQVRQSLATILTVFERLLVSDFTPSERDRADTPLLLADVENCRRFQQLEERGYADELCKGYKNLRKYFVKFAALPFASERGGEELLAALNLCSQSDGKQLSVAAAESLTNFIPRKWEKFLYDADDRFNLQLWLIVLALEVREALRAGLLYLPRSRSHVSFWNLVYHEEQWEQTRQESYADLSLASEADVLIENLRREYLAAMKTFEKSLPRNDFARIDNGELKLKRMDALPISESVKELRRTVETALPRIRIEDLLLAVDEVCPFTSQFRPVSGGSRNAKRTASWHPTLLAALIAHGTNLGISAMGHSAEEITVDMLQNVSRLYLSENNLKAANAMLVGFHHRMPFANVWGDGSSSSSDGQRFGVQESTLLASYYPRYFGYYERAITLYTHVSDRHSVFSTQVISCSVREALYVLDGILENDSILRIREHYTDTHGFTEQVFGMCYLLGLQFAPRLKDLTRQRLYKFEKGMTTGKLSSLLKFSVDLDLIKEQYDQLVRVAASLKNRTAPAHVVLQRLGQESPSDRVAKALTALGRIIKTIYIFRYLSDENLRRRVQRQLNRGEFRHFLAKRLFFANQGDFRQGDYEEIMNKASCLSLLSNAVLVWNTIEMERIVALLRAGGATVRDEDLRHVSPLAFQHVIPNGTYHFKKVKQISEV